MERLITLEDAAEILCMSPRMAKKVLSNAGLSPVALGVGRGKGNRWLKSAVEGVAVRLFANAQAKRKKQSKQKAVSLTTISGDDFFSMLTSTPPVQ